MFLGRCEEFKDIHKDELLCEAQQSEPADRRWHCL